MAGHSKWAQIKRQKGVADAKRGQLFTKLGREITVAARVGGPDPDGNPRLRLAIQRARESNMPMDVIKRAIDRGAGSGDAAALEEVVYEGYGPGGTAILVEAMTDNRNRTVAEIRNAFTRGGGSLGESGCVAWNFDQRGVVAVEPNGADPEVIALQAIEAGAEDFQVAGDTVEVYTDPSAVDQVRQALEQQGLRVASAETAMVPKTTLELDAGEAVSVMKLMERLEDLDDVQRVYSNLDVSEEALRQFA
ncbi:MAG: YebC/PmpR family DNA-binding transcriptional regulator [Chloroflexota bacterium]|nr:YebC/PmpR family DNA-binding transcriptional regulator [Chloroflexota bacterium]